MSKVPISPKSSPLPEHSTPEGRESLRKTAYKMTKDALDKGLESKDLNDKLKAMRIYKDWNDIEENNKVLMLNSILTATPEQIKILEGNLKKEKAIDDIKSGKPDIQAVYGLPKEEDVNNG